MNCLVVRLVNVLVIVIAGLTAAACSGDDHESTTRAPEVTAPTTREFEALIRRVAKKTRPVEQVFCHVVTDELVLCAVTLVGPSCQLWKLEAGEPAIIGPSIDGASASRSAKGVGCFS